MAVPSSIGSVAFVNVAGVEGGRIDVEQGRFAAAGSAAASGSEPHAAAGSAAAAGSEPQLMVDCSGCVVLPGFIDLQLNGGLGVDLASPGLSDAALRALLRALPRHGVTSVVGTLISSPPATYAAVVPVLRRAYHAQAPGCARLLGLHLEGPFLHADRRGAHAAANLLAPATAARSACDPLLLDGLPPVLAPLLAHCALQPSDLRAGLLRIVTLAPELPGAAELTAALTALGVVVAIGHTTASYDAAVDAVRGGARLVTHLFNAMPPLHHRAPGVIGLLGLPGAPSSGGSGGGAATAAAPLPPPLPAAGAAATVATASTSALPQPTPPVPFAPPSCDDASSPLCCPYFGLIADGGVHVHPAALALAYRAQPGRAILVTDGMSALGMPPGDYRYSDLDVTVRPAGVGGFGGLHAVLTGTETLAGAVLPLDGCVRYLAHAAGVSVADAAAAASAHPADALRLGAFVGRVAPGAAGDLVLLDGATLHVVRVFVGGVEVPLR